VAHGWDDARDAHASISRTTARSINMLIDRNVVVLIIAVLLVLAGGYDGLYMHSTKRTTMVSSRRGLFFMVGSQAGGYCTSEEVSSAVNSMQKLVTSKHINDVNTNQVVIEKLLLLGNTMKQKESLFCPADIAHVYWCIEKLCQIDSISAKLLQDPKVVEMIEHIDSINDGLQLPFKVLHQLLPSDMHSITIDSLLHEIPFKNDVLKSKDGKVFTERRKTCWMVEEHSNIGGLAYSGKIMPPGTY